MRYYIKRVKEVTWEQLNSFQVKLEKLDKMQTEANQLAQDWKNETDPVKKAQLFSLLSQKNQTIKELQREIKKDAMYDIFSQEKADELTNVVQNIFQGKESFFSWKNKEAREAQEQTQAKILGIDKETWKNLFLIKGILLGLGLIYALVSKYLKK